MIINKISLKVALESVGKRWRPLERWNVGTQNPTKFSKKTHFFFTPKPETKSWQLAVGSLSRRGGLANPTLRQAQ
jgi:hypothetical protein